MMFHLMNDILQESVGGTKEMFMHTIPVTYGYALQQCVRESVLGGLVAFSAIVGIIGSVSFPLLRKKLNVSRYCTPVHLRIVYLL